MRSRQLEAGSLRELRLHWPTTGLEPVWVWTNRSFAWTTGPRRFHYLIRYWTRRGPVVKANTRLVRTRTGSSPVVGACNLNSLTPFTDWLIVCCNTMINEMRNLLSWWTALFLKPTVKQNRKKQKQKSEIPYLRLWSHYEQWSRSWHGWFLGQSFLIRNSFYNDNFVDIRFKSNGRREQVVALIAGTSTFVPNDRSHYPFCVLPIMWCAFGAQLDVGLAERPTPWRFIGTQCPVQIHWNLEAEAFAEVWQTRNSLNCYRRIVFCVNGPFLLMTVVSIYICGSFKKQNFKLCQWILKFITGLSSDVLGVVSRMTKSRPTHDWAVSYICIHMYICIWIFDKRTGMLPMCFCTVTLLGPVDEVSMTCFPYLYKSFDKRAMLKCAFSAKELCE